MLAGHCHVINNGEYFLQLIYSGFLLSAESLQSLHFLLDMHVPVVDVLELLIRVDYVLAKESMYTY
jgi:hypothetical protein